MKSSKPNPGDVFLIPLDNGQFIPGQLIRFDRTLGCYSCGLFDQRVASPEAAADLVLDKKKCFSTLLMTNRAFRRGSKWPVIGKRKRAIPWRWFPHEFALRWKRGVGATLYDPACVEAFANAFCGLIPWNLYADPAWFDRMLLTPAKKPANLLYEEKDDGSIDRAKFT